MEKYKRRKPGMTYGEMLENEPVPDFNTLDEWKAWIKEMSDFYGKDDFIASDVYEKVYPTIKKLNDERRDAIHSERKIRSLKAMNEAGIRAGDTVEYMPTPRSQIAPILTIRGTVKIYKRGVVVKLDDRSASLARRKTTDWHEGWEKI